jgi:hypothetical protein
LHDCSCLAKARAPAPEGEALVAEASQVRKKPLWPNEILRQRL